MYLFTDVVPWQVNDRAETFQHVKDHLSVTALSRRGTKNKYQRVCVVYIDPFDPYLEKRDFADNGVVDIYGDVEPHLIRQLCQQFLLIWKGVNTWYRGMSGGAPV